MAEMNCNALIQNHDIPGSVLAYHQSTIMCFMGDCQVKIVLYVSIVFYCEGSSRTCTFTFTSASTGIASGTYPYYFDLGEYRLQIPLT